jgi:hypothetical protein
MEVHIMASKRKLISLLLPALLVAGWVLWSAGMTEDAPSREGWGGKAEHCAMAIGAIGASILSLFANPLIAPVSVGVMSLGLIWMVATCE